MLQNGERLLVPSINHISARTVGQEANQSDILRYNNLASDGQHMGQAVVDLFHIFNPKTIIVGGCVSQSGDLVINPIREENRKYTQTPEYLQILTIRSSEHQTEPG